MAEVAVIMAVYNGGSRLRACLDSILSQSGVDLDLVVIDDASCDGSDAILSEYAAEAPFRMHVVRNVRNWGLAASLNVALSLTSSQLIARMDADDISLPNRLRSQRDFLLRNPEVSVVGTGVLLRDGEGNDTPFYPRPTHDELHRRRFRECPVIHPTVMYRRHAVLAVGGYDPGLRRGQDYDLWIRMMRSGARFANIPEAGLVYRRPDAIGSAANLRPALRIAQYAVEEHQWLGALWSMTAAGAYLLSRTGLVRVGFVR